MTLESIQLQDAEGRTTAKILPGFGFNCYSFQASPDGKPVELLWSAPTFTTGTARPAGSGIPIMFPFAGRIAGTSFVYEGKTYQLEVGDDLGNAIHGFVHRRPWRVIEQKRQSTSGEFQASIDDPSLLERWPADFRIRVDYRVELSKLLGLVKIENPDTRPLPFGFGTHAYFRLPLSHGGRPDQCRVQVPVGNDWELAGLRPTGRFSNSDAAQRLAAGIPFGEMQFDNVFGGLEFDGGVCEARIHDPHKDRVLRLRFGEEYRFCVVFNPPHREAICIEPYTSLPDPFTLREQGIEPYQNLLAPGESWTSRFEISLQ
jgi:aldose 1-epimerase